MTTENLRFNLFEIFDNMIGDKKKLRITNNLDVYTTRTGDIHRVIRVHWEVLKTDEEIRRDYRKRGNHYPAHCYNVLSPTPLRDCMRQLTTSTNFRKTQSDHHPRPARKGGAPNERKIKC